MGRRARSWSTNTCRPRIRTSMRWETRWRSGISSPERRRWRLWRGLRTGREGSRRIISAAGTASISGAQGSSIIKLFEMTAASTGVNEKQAKALALDYDRVITFSPSHAGYYPGAQNLTIKTLFERSTGRLLGAQIVGFDGADKRIDVLACAMRAGLTGRRAAGDGSGLCAALLFREGSGEYGRVCDRERAAAAWWSSITGRKRTALRKERM